MKILLTLAEVSVYSAILYLAVLLFRRLLGNRLSPALHFLMWFLVAARLCAPITIESGFHLPALAQAQPASAAGLDLASLGEREIFYREPEIIQSGNASSPAASSNDGGAQAEPPGNDTVFPAPPAFNLTWADALLALWACGMAARALPLLLTGQKLRRAIRTNGLLPDERTRRVYAYCAEKLRLRRAPELRLLASIQTPALTVGLRPAVILPAQLAKEFSDERLSYALMHELTHYKRGDHLVALLLRALETVYWFNPVSWLLGRGMARDMETACDSAVASSLNGTARRAYAHTLLSLVSQPRRESYVLGMALSAERDAQRRIRSVFAPAKSGLPIRLAAALVSLALMFACFTTACQPTPEKEIIVNKGDDTLGAAIQNTPMNTAGGLASAAPEEDVTEKLRAALGVPEHWAYSGQSADGALNIVADADVTVPNALALPVANAELREFTQGDIDRVIEVLFGEGLTWYDGNTFTKEWVEEQLIAERASLAALDPNDGEYEFWKGKNEASIESYEKMYEDAPYEADLPIMDATIRRIAQGDSSYNGVSLRTQIGGDTYRFECGDWLRDQITAIGAGVGKNYVSYYDGVYRDTPWGVSLTKEQAAEQAKAIVSQLTDELKLCFVVPAATFRDSSERNWGWACVFMREVNAVGTMYTCEDVGSDMESDVQYPVRYEKIIVVLDDEGLIGFRWESPMRVTSIENENTAVLPFDEIAAKALEQVAIYQRYTAQNDPGATVTITRAELGLMRVAKR
ncbi:MAG TPA: DUF6034 family protein, partial [Clostridia bacterium]|nr:DUF6034 family protein [Clostridia bacterium]